VEKMMIALGILGLAATTTCGGCAARPEMTHVARAPVANSLVRGGGAADAGMYVARSDARLGTLSISERRIAEDAIVTVYDRQQTLDGRFYNNYRSVTRTTERLRR
jgi:hypothetical protein